MQFITPDLVRDKLPARPIDANKGTFGSVLIVAGSRRFPGSAILSALSAARAGAGLVTLATTPDVYKIAAPLIPFATFLKFSEIEENLEKYSTVLIGPGLGQAVDIVEMINDLIKLPAICDKKLVLDADCQNILSETADWYKKIENGVLTPHPKEMSRLTGLAVDDIQSHREEVAEKFAKLFGKTIVLKGAQTLIVTPEGEIFQSPFSNPLLATAGTGDILSGIIAGLLSQGLNYLDAAICGVYIQGEIAENLKEKFGDSGLIANDLTDKIPEIMKLLKSS